METNRLYLDYNATAPLAPTVVSWLAQGSFVWANPASQHSSGKKSRQEIESHIEQLHQVFSLPSAEFEVVFHSGATEGINQVVLGKALAAKKLLYVYSPIDHSSARLQVERVKALGHKTCELAINDQGELLLEESVNEIKRHQGDADVLINYTWVHNETGVVWPLGDAVRLKELTGATVHVDAAQSPGKIEDWDKLSPALDMYSFSSHKFGGFKGHGWSFISRKESVAPLILGGGQQRGSRSGTENAMASKAMVLALAHLQSIFRPEEQRAAITQLRHYVDNLLVGKGQRVSAKAQRLNLNTVYFVLYNLPSDMSLPLFDLRGLELSSGSACHSGTAKPSVTLTGLNLGPYSRNGLRLSTFIGFDSKDLNTLKSRLAEVFERIRT